MRKIIIYSVVVVIFVVSCKPANEVILSKKTPKPVNIILMIGDGMGITQVYAAMKVKKDKLNIEKAQIIGFSKTNSADNYITDSAAGATAIACGEKTNNGYIGINSSGNAMKTILEYAEDNGLSTGLVATSSVTHATPASFIAHQLSREFYENIALDFLKTDIDVFIGGGKYNFSKRKDSLNLIDSLIANNYMVLYNIDEALKVQNGKMACFTANLHNVKYSEGRGDMLKKATQSALNITSKNKHGLFLMVEGSMIDWGGHANDIDYVTSELIDFDNAVGIALDFAKKDGNTLVIVTADHETGGLSIIGEDSITGMPKVKFSTKDHSAVMVPVYAFGPGAENFAGIFENTELFRKIFDLYGFQKN